MVIVGASYINIVLFILFYSYSYSLYFNLLTRKSTASSWLWSDNKYYYIIYYDNIWQNVDIFLNKKQQQHIYSIIHI